MFRISIAAMKGENISFLQSWDSRRTPRRRKFDCKIIYFGK